MRRVCRRGRSRTSRSRCDTVVKSLNRSICPIGFQCGGFDEHSSKRYTFLRGRRSPPAVETTLKPPRNHSRKNNPARKHTKAHTHTARSDVKAEHIRCRMLLFHETTSLHFHESERRPYSHRLSWSLFFNATPRLGQKPSRQKDFLCVLTKKAPVWQGRQY